MDFVVSGCTLCASVLPLNEEPIFKYHKGSLVYLPLRCDTEYKLLKIVIGNVELEYKTSPRLSDVLQEPVLVHFGSPFLVLFARAKAMVVVPFHPFCWDLSVRTPSRGTLCKVRSQQFCFFHHKGRKLHFFSLAGVCFI